MVGAGGWWFHRVNCSESERSVLRERERENKLARAGRALKSDKKLKIFPALSAQSEKEWDLEISRILNAGV